jgi:hypothetical protein
MPSESARVYENGRSSGQLLAQGWKRRYTVAIVVLALAIAAAIWLPSSDADPRSQSHTLHFTCLLYSAPGQDECPPLNHHDSLRLLIASGGFIIAVAIAFFPHRRERQLTPSRLSP